MGVDGTAMTTGQRLEFAGWFTAVAAVQAAVQPGVDRVVDRSNAAIPQQEVRTSGMEASWESLLFLKRTRECPAEIDRSSSGPDETRDA
jgi:hypothetical protein